MVTREKSVRLLDPRLAREDEVVDVISEGPASVTYATVVCPDQTSSAPSFVIQPPSVNSGLARTLRLRAVGTLTVNGTNFGTTGANTLSGFGGPNAVALRAWPLHSSMTSVQVQLNNFTTSLGSVGLYMPGLAAVGFTSAAMAASTSTAPTQPDLYADYPAEQRYGSAFKPVGMGGYDDDQAGGRTAAITAISFTGTTQMTVTYDISEPLVLSPFTYGCVHDKYLYGIQTATISISYANFHRMLSVVLGATTGGATISSVTNQFTAQSIECEFVTPGDGSLVERPIRHVYDWMQVQYYATTSSSPIAGASAGSGAPGAPALLYNSGSITSNAIELPVIPQKIIVYATYNSTDLADPTRSLADIFLPMTSCSITFGTRSGLLAGATSRNLYDISRRGGLRAKYPVFAAKQYVYTGAGYGIGTAGTQSPFAAGFAAVDANAGAGTFSGAGSATAAPTYPHYAGAPLVIDCAADLSLPAGEQPVPPGVSQRIQFSVTATFENHLSPVTAGNLATIPSITPRLVILVLTPGYICIQDGAAMGALGGVSLETARTAPIAPLLQADVLQRMGRTEGISGGRMMTGGSILGDLWDGVKSVAGTVAPIVLPSVLGKLGLGGATAGGAARARMLGKK